MTEALTGLGIALIVMVGGLIPYLGPAAKAALVAYTEKKHLASINAAADTLAAVAAKPNASPLDKDLTMQVAKLKDRVADAVDVLEPTDDTLRDMLTKAAAKAAGVAPALTGLEGRGA